MSRKWKPGDVALWDDGDGSPEVIFRYLGGDDYDVPEWRTAANGAGYPKAYDIRPLVVIDPEDREQVERLRDLMDGAWVEHGNGQVEAWARGARGNALQAALREFADPKPPKPDEPTGLGAVVEDDKGRPWIRWSNGRGCVWRCPDTVAFDGRAYDSISAVRVLSEGVQL